MASVSEFFQDIEINPKKSKNIIKWIVYISLFLIMGAFTTGQILTNKINKLNKIETQVSSIDKKITILSIKTDSAFKSVDKKFQDGYSNGLDIMDNYQEHVQSQLELLVDYGSENKELLKSALKLRESDNERLINQTVEAAIKDLNNVKSNNDIDDNKTHNQSEIKVISKSDLDKSLTLDNVRIEQLDSISINNKILYIELLPNGNYSIKYIKK
jgi:hypothetical protein